MNLYDCTTSGMNYLTSAFSIGVHTLIFHTNFQIELQKHFTYLEVNYSTISTTWNTDNKQAKRICAAKSGGIKIHRRVANHSEPIYLDLINNYDHYTDVFLSLQ